GGRRGNPSGTGEARPQAALKGHGSRSCSRTRDTDLSMGLLVQGDILAGRCLPRQIGGHAALDDRLPSFSGLIEQDGALDGSEEGAPAVFAKRESIALRWRF